MQLPESELILNPDGSIYHLNLLPEDIANNIIFVGDPDRVPMVSAYFDHIEIKKAKREFVTHTGTLHGKRLTVISTGISTDNIDIVINELDALVNIDLSTRTVKSNPVALDIIRIGTSGSLQKEVLVDDFVVSKAGIGMDGLMHFYPHSNEIELTILNEIGQLLSNRLPQTVKPYWSPCSEGLLQKIASDMRPGITLTCPGFYAPQGRFLRAGTLLGVDFLEKIGNLSQDGTLVTNFEMETAGIYGLSNLLGHRALSCNAILANRITNTFSKNPKGTVKRLIETVLEKIAD